LLLLYGDLKISGGFDSRLSESARIPVRPLAGSNLANCERHNYRAIENSGAILD
jgi:hypothetical protein